MTSAERRVVKQAMEWYRRWRKHVIGPPAVKDGFDLGEVPLFRACEQLEREQSKGQQAQEALR